MKKLELYQCEVCGTQYKSELECTECETRHMKELRIVKSRYLPFTQDRSGIPTTITLMGPDGRHYTYKR